MGAAEHLNRPSRSDFMMVELLSRFSLLMEQLLVDLQVEVRDFVAKMNEATIQLDGQVTEEGEQARQLFESVFEETQKESQILNERAASRVDDIISGLLESGEAGAGVDEGLKNAIVDMVKTPDAEPAPEEGDKEGAQDSVWSKVSKNLESVARLEERLRPQVYSIIECLGFEDIQSQRLDHLLKGFKELNQAVAVYLNQGEEALEDGDLQRYANNFLKRLRGSYTMESERQVFDKVFPSKKK